MKNPLHICPATLLAALLCVAAAGATVHKVDDTTVVGDLVGVSKGHLVLSIAAAPAPTTRAATQATASTHRVEPAKTATTVAVPLADVAQVVLREPVAPKTVPATTPNAQPGRRHSRGLFSALVGSVFGGSEDDNDSNDDAPVASVVPAPVVTPPPRVPTTGPITWLVVLGDGDRLHGVVGSWDAGTLNLRPTVAAAGAVLAIPTDQLVELWIGDPGEQTKARALMPADAGADDVAFVRKDADAIVAVRGTALRLAGDAMVFWYDGRQRKLSTAKLVGLVFGNRKPVPPGDGAGLQFTAKLNDGDAITGPWVGLDHDRLTLRTAWGQPLPLAAGNVFSMVAVGGRLTYLSDLKPVKVEQVPFFGRPVPYRVDRSLGGGPIRLADGTHDKGIAVHARCLLEYDLAGRFDHLRGEVGFEQPDAKLGTAALRLTGDGRTLFDNADARGDQPPTKLDLDVTGVRHLSLLVDFGPGGQGVRARVDWADLRLLRGTGTAGREK